jgi:hypothetical protein
MISTLVENYKTPRREGRSISKITITKSITGSFEAEVRSLFLVPKYGKQQDLIEEEELDKQSEQTTDGEGISLNGNEGDADPSNGHFIELFILTRNLLVPLTFPQRRNCAPPYPFRFTPRHPSHLSAAPTARGGLGFLAPASRGPGPLLPPMGCGYRQGPGGKPRPDGLWPRGELPQDGGGIGPL